MATTVADFLGVGKCSGIPLRGPARDGEFDRMNDGSNTECGYNARLSVTENSPAEWHGTSPNRRCDDLDNLLFCAPCLIHQQRLLLVFPASLVISA